MIEWVLLMTLNIKGPVGDIRDVSLSTLGGFTSSASCEAAGKALAVRAIGLVGRARMQQGIVGNSGQSTPALNTECVQVTK